MIFPLQTPAPLPFLSPAFGSHMVMQRGRPNSFWGWTKPGGKVTVSVAGKKASGKADATGKWLVRIDPPKVGGPYRVTVDGDQRVLLEDVLVGDVWLCTGQSNMEMGLTQAAGGMDEVAKADDPKLRLFTVEKATALTPLPTLRGDWKVCTPASVAEGGWGGFSAVGYFFGKALRRETGIPIGLVADNWGGTNAESWMSREAAGKLKDFDPALAAGDAYTTGGERSYAARVLNWYAANDPGSKTGVAWAATDLDLTDWKPVAVPNGFSSLGLDGFDGTAWFRKEVTLTEAQAAGAATLDLGVVDDYDTTWVNGVLVGSPSGGNVAQRHTVPAGTLHAGRNVIAVRVLDTGGGGGFTSPAEALTLTLADGTKLPLSGEWQGHVGAPLNAGGGFPTNISNDPNQPTSLYNGMIAPLLPLAIKGAIWYQGENNAGRAEQYRRVLPAMIADWRDRFDSGDFPFYIVSLAAFMPHKGQPGNDEWAELREAQALTAKNMGNSGLALAIDVGDAADIHPKDKKTVGERLALVALARDYGKKVVYEGPTFRSLRVKGTEARVEFDHADGGLLARGGPLGEFALAGADRKWHWATARIDGDAVVLTSPDVPVPVAVRYAWQSNPVATLTNGAGLPAVPFRTDDWPMLTAGRK